MKALASLFIALAAGMIGVMENWVELAMPDSNPFVIAFCYWFVVAAFCMLVYWGALFLEFIFVDEIAKLEEVIY